MQRVNIFLFLNNDIEIITKDYMERMLTLCGKENTGAVGAKLYYPDDTIQHAGIVIGIGGHARGIAANMCVGQVRSDSGYMYRASLRQKFKMQQQQHFLWCRRRCSVRWTDSAKLYQ